MIGNPGGRSLQRRQADLIGLLFGDQVKVKRAERLAVLWHRTHEPLRDRGIDPEPPSLKYAIPILEAAADEENDELQDLWSRLLAAAMDLWSHSRTGSFSPPLPCRLPAEPPAKQ